MKNVINYSLTKTRYLSALQCHKRVWMEIHRNTRIPAYSRAQRRVLDQGTEVGVLARQRFPGGVLIDAFGQPALDRTAAALARGVTCLFEPAFVYDGVLVRCDILHKIGMNAWELIEVKSSTMVKEYHLHDLAVQRYVLEGCGLRVTSVRVMHINTQDCAYPLLDNLFTLADVTRDVMKAQRKVTRNLKLIRTVLAQPDEPGVPIGWHCDQPFTCPLKSHCWRNVPEMSIFTIPRLGEAKVTDLVRRGILSVYDVPRTYPLSPIQRDYVDRVISGKPLIDKPRIRKRMAGLTYPIHFLDFETISFAVPRYIGLAPYQAAPFQYSLHVLERDQTLRHRDYLQQDGSDPRRGLLQALLNDLGEAGSVVVYNATFEREVLRGLARLYPSCRQQLESIIDRLWDQHEIFRRHYFDPRFAGSTSIKKVLPVVAPGLTYAGLAIQRGDDAQSVWLDMLAIKDPAQAAQMAEDLRAYCKLDTLAMVEIHRALEASVRKG